MGKVEVHTFGKINWLLQTTTVKTSYLAQYSSLIATDSTQLALLAGYNVSLEERP